VQGLAYKGKTEMEFNSDIMNRGGQAPVQVIKASYRLTEGREEEGSLQGQKMSLLHSSSPSPPNKILVKIPIFIHSFIHSFIMHSVNPYKVNQPIGYRACHDTNVI
jgi:hypothetical protein